MRMIPLKLSRLKNRDLLVYRMTEKHIPMRRCIGCKQSFPQEKLIRISFDGKFLKPDIMRFLDGRGAYLCKDEKCIMNAKKKKAFDRTFKYGFENADIDNLIQEVRSIISGGI